MAVLTSQKAKTLADVRLKAIKNNQCLIKERESVMSEEVEPEETRSRTPKWVNAHRRRLMVMDTMQYAAQWLAAKDVQGSPNPPLQNHHPLE